MGGIVHGSNNIPVAILVYGEGGGINAYLLFGVA